MPAILPNLPSAGVEVDLERSSGVDAGIVQDTAIVEANAWAAMSADITTFASSYGYSFTTYPKAAGVSYSGNFFTDEQSVKNWIAATNSQGDMATSPTGSGSSGAIVPLVLAGMVGAVGVAWWLLSRRR